jgi:hypothetical protein
MKSMGIKEVYMTQTIQPCFRALIETGRNLTKDMPDMEDNRSLLLAVFDSLNKLSEKLSRLNYLMERKRIEQILYRK